MTKEDPNAHRKGKVRIDIVLSSNEHEAYLRAKRILGDCSNNEAFNSLVKFYLGRGIMSEEYKGFTITYDPKPIPPRCGVDYNWFHPNYDADYQGDNGLAGNGASVEHCKEQIDELLDDMELSASISSSELKAESLVEQGEGE